MKDRFYYKFLSCTFLGALGEYMALATLSWYLLENYSGLSVLGKVLSFRIFPRFFMGFIGGYLADLYNKKGMMIFIYGGILLTSLCQTILVTAFDRPAWYALAGVLFVRSVFDGAEPSVRNAILPHIVEKKPIAKAIGYYSTGLNLAAILAPMIAAFMMSQLKISAVFWIDLAFQIPSFIVLFYIPYIEETLILGKHRFITSYKKVLKFIYHSPVLYKCVITSVLTMMTLFPFGAMLSIYVKEGLNLSVKVYGFISGAEAAGAVLAGVLVSKIFHQPQKKFFLWYTLALLSGVSLLLLSLKPDKVWVYILIFIFGLLTQLFRTYSRIIFQENTPDDMRGKIMSIIISDSGFISIGLLLFTFLADKWSITLSILCMGITTIVIICFVIIIDYMKTKPSYK